MNYILLADGLWYSGHILTCSSIMFSQTNRPLAISLVFVGQFITIISRPISRINNTAKIAIKETTILV
jgi:hypothetical protein